MPLPLSCMPGAAVASTADCRPVRPSLALALSVMLVAVALPAAARAQGAGAGTGADPTLLGGPPAARDLYRSALNANETQETDLMKAERIPNDTLGRGYEPLPAAPKPPARVAAEPDDAPADNAQQAAQVIYRNSLKSPEANPAGQPIYRMPW